MRVDWCVSSWFRIKNTHSLTHKTHSQRAATHPDWAYTSLIDGKAKHSPTNDWDTNAVWVDARQAMTVTQERHTEPQDKTLSQTDCHTS